jgi:hypothetical protein
MERKRQVYGSQSKKPDTYFFPEGGFDFSIQSFNKLTYLPVSLVILMALTDEEIVFVSQDKAVKTVSHYDNATKGYNSNKI